MASPVPEELARFVAAGRGDGPADLVVKNARLLDLTTGALRPGDIAVCGDRIVGILDSYGGAREIDAENRIVVPGFIDTHLHIESSLVTPLEFDRCVLPRGVTSAICDPHEIANVLGGPGIAFMLEGAAAAAMDIRVMLPSCVPATELETSGARLEASDLLPFFAHPKALGLAEVMNYPGVVAGDRALLAKIAGAGERPIDGHAPLLAGRPLNAYLAAGIQTDHEATSAAEALDKLARGMTILVREGSVSKDLAALAPIITDLTAPFLAFCTDDRNPLDIAEEGHIDHLVRASIAAGAPPLAAYRMATVSAARAFGLRDRGLVAPGYRADFVLLDDLDTCAVAQVVSAGRIVDDALFAARPSVAPVGRRSVKAPSVTAADFSAPAMGPTTAVIGVEPGKILTRHLRLSLPMRSGARTVDLDQDAVKVAVVARHGHNRNIAVAFVHGFGLRRGAIASSVGHDSHNICVVGAHEADMALAVNRLAAIEGGFCVAAGGAILAELALPVAGLMSLLAFEDVRDALLPLRGAAKDLGVTLPEPFLQVAFLPLPVIPHLKITDRGLVDVDRMEFVRD